MRRSGGSAGGQKERRKEDTASPGKKTSWHKQELCLFLTLPHYKKQVHRKKRRKKSSMCEIIRKVGLNDSSWSFLRDNPANFFSFFFFFVCSLLFAHLRKKPVGPDFCPLFLLLFFLLLHLFLGAERLVHYLFSLPLWHLQDEPFTFQHLGRQPPRAVRFSG